MRGRSSSRCERDDRAVDVRRRGDGVERDAVDDDFAQPVELEVARRDAGERRAEQLAKGGGAHLDAHALRRPTLAPWSARRSTSARTT